MKKIAILSSGAGSNAENIYRFFGNGNRIKVELVIYDRRNAPVAERMRALGVDTLYLPAEVWTERPEEIVELLIQRGIDLVVLAGFLRVVPPALTSAFPGKMLNIHPSLLPAHGGKGMYGRKVHESVIASGDTRSGATVHYVSDDIDGGEILMQETVEVSPEDTPESLETKVRRAEFNLYPRAIVTALARNGASAVTEHMASKQTVSGETADTDARHIPNHPQPGEEWAETLGVNYDPTKLPPEYPGAVPPPMPEMSANAGAPSNPMATAYGNQSRTMPNASQAYADILHKAYGDKVPKMPPSYLVWAVVMTVLCCLPAGIVAIIFSSQVSSKYYSGDIEGATRASERAQIWIIISFVLGVLSATLYMPVALLFN